jgi:hypothetical protein
MRTKQGKTSDGVTLDEWRKKCRHRPVIKSGWAMIRCSEVFKFVPHSRAKSEEFQKMELGKWLGHDNKFSGLRRENFLDERHGRWFVAAQAIASNSAKRAF